MKPDSFWLDTAPAFTGEAPLAGEARADVAVVGAGFMGLSAALTLAKKGVSVRVLEAGRVAAEASGRNGGHCNNGLSHDFSGVAARFGVERAREMYRAFDSGVDLVESLVRSEKIDCDFTRSGKPVLTYWYPSNLPNAFPACTTRITVWTGSDTRITNPVMVDMRDGAIRPLKGGRRNGGWVFPDMPLGDWPVLITDASVVA